MKTLKMQKKGTILAENVVFIVLNLVFFGLLLVFVYIQSSNTASIQQETAKQIALLIDAAKLGTEIKLDIDKVLEKKDEKIRLPIEIDNENNLVIVRMTEKSYYEYSFFNDVYADAGIVTEKTGEKYYRIVIK